MPALRLRPRAAARLCRRAAPARSAGSYPSSYCSFLGTRPSVGEGAWVAPSATVVGDVRLGRRSSVFYNCVLRADINYIEVGDESNIQDGTVVHLSRHLPTRIGRRVTVGHGAIVHACTVEDNVLVGMGAIVMDGATVGRDSIVAAGALVPAGKTFPPRSLLVGSPARRVRELTQEEVDNVDDHAERYLRVAHEHARL